MSKSRDAMFRALLERAMAAGLEAGSKCVPVPMRVVERENPLNDASPIKKDYGVYADGVCGFAGVRVRPGNSAFAKYLVKEGKARPASYAGGVYISVHLYNQSLAKKEAHAAAMAAVFREAGIKANMESRMD